MIQAYHFYAVVLSITFGLSTLYPFTPLAAQDFDFPEIEEVPNLESDFIEARMWMILEQYDQAVDILENLLEKDPNNPVFLYEMARSLDQIDQAARALEYAERGHRYDPSNSWILQLLANLAASVDRDDLAEDSYRKLLDLHPGRTNYGISRAYHLLLMDRREEAVRTLNQVEETSGITPNVSRKKISIFTVDENWEAIDREYKQLINAFPRQIDFKMEYASFLEKRNLNESAVQLYREILSIEPDYSRARLRLTELEMGEKGGDDRLQALRPLLENPSVELDEKIQALMPMVIQLSEQYDQQLTFSLSEIAEILMELHPNRAESFAIAADIQFSGYQFVRASKLYALALNIRPGIIQLWLNEFESLLRSGQYSDLKERVEEGMDFYPNQALFQYYLARSLAGLNKFPEAENALRRGVLMSRRQPELRLYFFLAEGALERAKGEFKAAAQILNNAIEEFPGEPDLMLLKAGLLLDNGQTESELTDLLEKLEELIPHDPDYLFLAARFYHLMGQSERALKYFEAIEKFDISDRSDIAEWKNKIQG